MTMFLLNEAQLAAIEKKLHNAIEARKAKLNPADHVKPVFLSCLENLTNPKLIAAIIDERLETVESYINYKSEERLRGRLDLLLARAKLLTVIPGMEKDFFQTMKVNVDTKHPEWISGAQIVEGLLEIAEALTSGTGSENVAQVCERFSNHITHRKMSIIFGWIETYVPEGKEFVAWLSWYREEQRQRTEQELHPTRPQPRP